MFKMKHNPKKWTFSVFADKRLFVYERLNKSIIFTTSFVELERDIVSNLRKNLKCISYDAAGIPVFYSEKNVIANI